MYTRHGTHITNEARYAAAYVLEELPCIQEIAKQITNEARYAEASVLEVRV